MSGTATRSSSRRKTASRRRSHEEAPDPDRGGRPRRGGPGAPRVRPGRRHARRPGAPAGRGAARDAPRPGRHRPEDDPAARGDRGGAAEGEGRDRGDAPGPRRPRGRGSAPGCARPRQGVVLPRRRAEGRGAHAGRPGLHGLRDRLQPREVERGREVAQGDQGAHPEAPVEGFPVPRGQQDEGEPRRHRGVLGGAIRPPVGARSKAVPRSQVRVLRYDATRACAADAGGSADPPRTPRPRGISMKAAVAVLALAAALLAAAPAADAVNFLIPGQKAFGTIGVADEEDVVYFRADAGWTVTFTLKARKGETLLPQFTRLEDPDGDDALPSAVVTTTKKGNLTRLRITVAEGGTW